jgi:hypothetical protein
MPTPEEVDLENLIGRLEALVGHLAPCGARWLPIDAASTYSGLSQQSIRRLLAAGKLTPHRPVPGRVLIDKRQLDALIQAAVGRPRSKRGRRSRGTDAVALPEVNGESGSN